MNIDEYKKAIDNVLTFMTVNKFNFILDKFTIGELEGFVQMSGLNLKPFWIRFVARGVRRTIAALEHAVTTP